MKASPPTPETSEKWMWLVFATASGVLIVASLYYGAWQK
jgi:hypothetical protein